MIPTSVITFVISTAISAYFKFANARSEAREKQHSRLIDIATHNENSQKARNSITNKSFQWTKRFLAVSAWSVYWGAKVALLLGLAALPIIHGEPVEVHHGFWIFGWTETVFKFTEVPGVPFTSFDYHMLSAIVGSYFGASIMSRD
jgi:hypothetical protein